MYNTDLPARADLPTSERLWRSTIIAAISALVILTTVVLPSEYAVDPTGAGRMLGLTEMGEIKNQLAIEAEADRQAARQQAGSGIESRLSSIEQRLGDISALLSAGASKSDAGTRAAASPQTDEAAPPVREAAALWKHEVSFTLKPGEGIELKLVMQEGAEAAFEWTANGSLLNYDTHGDGNGNSISYEKGRGIREQAGILRAAFTGNHGWFWRNRTRAPVTLTLRTRGDYTKLKRTG